MVDADRFVTHSLWLRRRRDDQGRGESFGDAKPFAPAITPPKEIELSENSRQVLKKRYLRRGLDGKPVEDVEGMFRRVARAVAEPDGATATTRRARRTAFTPSLAACVSSRTRPHSRAPARRSGNSPHVSSCRSPMTWAASPTGIFQTLRDAALIQQTGGGNGFSFTNLRPERRCGEVERGRCDRAGRLPPRVRHCVWRGGSGRMSHARDARLHLQGTAHDWTKSRSRTNRAGKRTTCKWQVMTNGAPRHAPSITGWRR